MLPGIRFCGCPPLPLFADGTPIMCGGGPYGDCDCCGCGDEAIDPCGLVCPGEEIGRPLLLFETPLIITPLPALDGVCGRTDFETINGDSRLPVRESMVRGDAVGDGTAGGRYELWCMLLYGA